MTDSTRTRIIRKTTRKNDLQMTGELKGVDHATQSTHADRLKMPRASALRPLQACLSLSESASYMTHSLAQRTTAMQGAARGLTNTGGTLKVSGKRARTQREKILVYGYSTVLVLTILALIVNLIIGGW